MRRPVRAVPFIAAAVALLVAAPAGGTAAGADRAGVAPAGQADGPDGEALYLEGCSSCHGARGHGTARGPALVQSGEAAAYYYLSTGRMPLANSEEQPRRKPPVYDDDEIASLVDYVESLGEGPELPDLGDTLAGADLAAGGEHYRDICQACHSASGAGGALSYGRAAPRLAPATPLQVAAAVRSGPGQMPVFGPDVLSELEVAQLAAYVEHLDDPADPGGLPIGRTGPIPEGFVAWFLGMAALLGLVAWIGTRSPAAHPR